MDPVKSRGKSVHMQFASICFVKNARDKMITPEKNKNPLKSIRD